MGKWAPGERSAHKGHFKVIDFCLGICVGHYDDVFVVKLKKILLVKRVGIAIHPNG